MNCQNQKLYRVLEGFISEQGDNSRSYNKSSVKLKDKIVVNSKNIESRTGESNEDHIAFYEFSIESDPRLFRFCNCLW